jgi:glucose/mannose-6-phosphate isomerase
MALGYLFLPAVALLAEAGVAVAPPADVDEAIAAVEAQAPELAPARPTETNEAKRLALAIGNRLPAIYGGPGTAAVAYRWKTDIEENAKTVALSGALPEMNHNEIEAWQPPAAKQLHAIFLRDAAEAPDIARRFEIVRELITPGAGGVSEARGRGVSRLARLLTLAYLGQWTSYYLAVLRERDPWTVPILDELKRRMRGPLP